MTKANSHSDKWPIMAFENPDLSQEVIKLASFIREKGGFFIGGVMPLCNKEEEKIVRSWGILSLSF